MYSTLNVFLKRNLGHFPQGHKMHFSALFVHQVTGGQQEYFDESDIYWTPASTVNGLYEQLFHYKYREITRQHIEYDDFSTDCSGYKVLCVSVISGPLACWVLVNSVL